MLTFLCSFTEDGIMLVDGYQGDVFIINDVLRVFEAVVSAQEMIDCRRKDSGKLMEQNDVEDLSRSLVVLRQASFTQFLSCAVELPVDTLHCDEHQPQQLV